MTQKGMAYLEDSIQHSVRNHDGRSSFIPIAYQIESQTDARTNWTPNHPAVLPPAYGRSPLHTLRES
jgi:hypothetical protein